jgi:hypothetical protein
MPILRMVELYFQRNMKTILKELSIIVPAVFAGMA